MTDVKTIKDLLNENPFFDGMKQSHIEFIAGCGKLVRFNDGEFIQRENDKCSRFYIIRHGDVAIESFLPGTGPIISRTVRDGGILGYAWLYPPYRAEFDIRAMNAVSAIEMDGLCLRKKIDGDPELGCELMKRFTQIISEQLQSTLRQLLDIYAHNGTKKNAR